MIQLANVQEFIGMDYAYARWQARGIGDGA